jgi:hypothetical protein
MADESKPEVVAVRTGVGIDSRPRVHADCLCSM